MTQAHGGVRYVLELAAPVEPFTYRGRVELEGEAFELEVVVARSEATPDGLVASARAPTVPERYRATLERTVAAMARGAVRGALRDGTAPPRRLHRWRELPSRKA
jgi:hypothetical protein